ncbi:hypothetical protein AMTRI_Chr10g6810 [Amborella trichopoda]
MLVFSALQFMADLVVAGMSLFLGLWVFGFVACILCSAAFLQSARDVS